jgi:hypothetical protein
METVKSINQLGRATLPKRDVRSAIFSDPMPQLGFARLGPVGPGQKQGTKTRVGVLIRRTKTRGVLLCFARRSQTSEQRRGSVQEQRFWHPESNVLFEEQPDSRHRFLDENPHFLSRGDEIPEGGYEIPPSITEFLDVGNKFWGDCFLFPLFLFI